MMSLRYAASFFSVALLIGWIADAEAIVIRAELKPELEEIDTPIFPNYSTKVAAPVGTVITNVDQGDSEDYLVTITGSRELSIKVLDDPQPSNLTITLRDNRYITLSLFKADNASKWASRVECFEPGTMPTSLAVAAADLELAKWMATAKRVEEPVEIPWSVDEHELLLKTGFAVYTPDAVLLTMNLSSTDSRYPLSKLELRDHQGVEVNASLVYAEHELLTGKAVVHPEHKVTIAYRVADPHQIAKGWTLLATPATRIPPAEFRYEDRRKRSPLRRKVAVSMQAFGGASNLDDGAGNNETAWTALQGVGACATYGASNHLSMEGCLDFSRTSDVVFSDAMWDQNQGDLTVGETAGRLMAAGLLHTSGQRFIPFARLALGARFSKHDMAMGSQQESKVRSGALFGLGAGLNVMLGKRAFARLSFSYTTSFSGSDQAEGIEIGVSIATLWRVRR